MQKGHKRGTPPPIGGAASALYPHNFSRHKNRKKFAQEDIIFRTKNTSKSQPALGWKKFRKKFAGKCFGGKRKAPNLVERGRGVLKYGRLVSCAKIVELFWNARGEFFHFVFVPKSLVYVLLGVVFMTCPHSVLECVEFAERDSFLDTPNTEHHFECFDIVGSVVLRVVYLFHIPYQILWIQR